MTKKEKIRQIYSILKESSGKEFGTDELLKTASQLIKATEDSIYEPKFSIKPDSIKKIEMPLYQFFEQMTWLEIFNNEFNNEDEGFYNNNPQLVIDNYYR